MLAQAPFDVSGVLSTPQLTLTNTSSNATITTATAWGGSSALASLFSQVGAFGLPAGSADCAIDESLSAGSYTSEIAGLNSTTGIALAEIYDADTGSSTAYLANLSARANVGTGGNILIAGFVVAGDQPVTVLLRGVGPTLSQAPLRSRFPPAPPTARWWRPCRREATRWNCPGPAQRQGSGLSRYTCCSERPALGPARRSAGGRRVRRLDSRREVLEL